jgi:lysophospholipase L1-like esterase
MGNSLGPNGVTDRFGGGLDDGFIDDAAVNGFMDIGTMRQQWGKDDSILGTPEFFAFPVPFGAPPVVQITRGSAGAPLTPRQVSTTGFTIDRADNLPNPIPFAWTATGITTETVVPPSTRFNVIGLPTWSAAVRAQKAGKRNARILCVGDSTTAGFGANGASMVNNDKANSYPTLLAGILTARGSKASWSSFIGNASTLVQNTYDNRIVTGASWNYGANTAGGFTQRSSGTATAFTFTPTEQWDTAEIYVFKGEVTAQNAIIAGIDGVDKATISTMYYNASPGYVFPDIIGGVSPGVHVLNLRGVHATGAVHVLGAIAYNSTVKEITVVNAGWSGGRSIDWSSGTEAFSPTPVIAPYNPDLVILNLGINDANGSVVESAYMAQMQTIINGIKATGADILFVIPNACDPSFMSTRLESLSLQMLELINRNSLKYIDLRATLGTYAQAVAAGWMRDGAHPNAAGYAKIAEAIADAIFPAT